MMTRSMAKPKAKRASRASGARQSPANAKKAKILAKPRVKTRPGSAAKRAAGKQDSLIDERIRSLGGWRAETLAEVRRLIHAADPDIVEECKWIKPTSPLGVPVWSHAGIVCTGEAYQHVVKLTFARGASLKDPRELFNSSLEGNTRRAIDIREGEGLHAEALTALIQAAVAENLRSSASKSQLPKLQSPKLQSLPKAGAKSKPGVREAKLIKVRKGEKVVLLSGGNPQIAKGEGDAPVQAYIAAMPGWKRDIGKRLDALIERCAPGVRKAVKWNSPFYGIDGQGWFLSFHVFTHYVKLTFFRGTSLRPVLLGGTGKDARWIDIHEHDLDEARMATWVKQAAALPGWLT